MSSAGQPFAYEDLPNLRPGRRLVCLITAAPPGDALCGKRAGQCVLPLCRRYWLGVHPRHLPFTPESTVGSSCPSFPRRCGALVARGERVRPHLPGRNSTSEGGCTVVKRPLSRLRLTPRGRLRRNVVLLLLLPWPCCSSSAPASPTRRPWSGSRAASTSARWTPPSGTRRRRSTPSRYDRWYAVCSLERQPFSSGTPGGPMPGD